MSEFPWGDLFGALGPPVCMLLGFVLGKLQVSADRQHARLLAEEFIKDVERAAAGLRNPADMPQPQRPSWP